MAHALLRSASTTRRGVVSDSSRQTGTGSLRGEPRERDQVGRWQGLFDAQHAGVGQRRQHGDVLVGVAERAVRIDLDHELGVGGPHASNGFEFPPGLDLHAQAGGAGRDGAPDLFEQDVQVTSGRDPDHRADGERLEPRFDAEGGREGAVDGSQFGVGDRHLERSGEHPVGGRTPEELRHLCGAGQLAVSGGAGAAQARDSTVDGQLPRPRRGPGPRSWRRRGRHTHPSPPTRRRPRARRARDAPGARRPRCRSRWRRPVQPARARRR